MQIRIIVFLIMSLSSLGLNAQQYRVEKGTVRFFSEAPLEDIEAIHHNPKGAIRLSDSSIVILLANIAFEFDKSLMEEHFNENYMETETYPYSKFKGKIVSGCDFQKDGEYAVTVEGDLEIHGVTLKRTVSGTITKKGDKLILHAKFSIHVADHEVEVPSMYIDNIAEDVEVTINLQMKVK